jgi:hypothetical protein
MARVRVPKPMGRELGVDAGSGRRALEHVINGALGDMAAAGRGKYGIIVASIAA